MKRNNPMDIDDFIKIHHPENGSEPWISYNESIITPDYKIIECIPSHEKCMLRLIKQYHKISAPDIANEIGNFPIDVSPIHYMIEKYKFVSLWYDSIIIYPGALMDTNISNMINKLFVNNLLATNILNSISIAHDYTSSRFNKGEISYDEYLQFMERINNRRS